MRAVIANGLDGVAQQNHLVALLGDQAAHQQVVGGAIFKLRVAAESVQARAGGGDGGSQGELHSVQLPGHQNAGVEIGHHSDGLQVVGQSLDVQLERRNR